MTITQQGTCILCDSLRRTSVFVLHVIKSF